MINAKKMMKFTDADLEAFDADLKVKLGGQYRVMRTVAKVGLRKAAAGLQCSINTICSHERGERMLRAHMIYRSAVLFECPADALVDPAYAMMPKLKKGKTSV
jgi:hypothetical protein